MDESWARAVELFHAALERDESSREAFLRDACKGDDALYRTVLSLVAADRESSDDRFDAIAEAAAAELTGDADPARLIGRRVGRFRVISHLGSGGMGDVYRATDPVLGRDVALKLLAPRFQADDSLRFRLTKEARAASALNHPNIVTIFEVGRADSHEFVASELVEGVTLRNVIAQGPVAVHELARIGGEIAAGLSAAHAAGIIHRDMKPENVVIRQDGLVKVVDFGLAKGTAVRPGGESTGVWLTSLVPTGVIAGTACYMSPEQALGEPVDHRTDIFSLGVVLYEMATGVRPFDGRSDAAMYDALLHLPAAPPSALRSDLPGSVDAVIGRALEKDRELRYQSAADLAADLKRLQRPSSASSFAPVMHRRTQTRGRPVALLIGALTTLVAFAAGLFVRPATDPPKVARFTITPPARTEFTRTGTIVPSITTAVSPDGRRVAFVANPQNRPGLLWIRDIDATDATPLDGTSGAEFPFWSPDSRNIAFFADGALRVKPLSGGATRTIATVVGGRGGTWSQAGVILFGTSEGAVFRVPSAGGRPSPVTVLDSERGEAWHRFPEFLPDGHHFLYLARAGDDRAIYVGSLDGGRRTRLLETEVRASYTAPGYILFVQHAALWARPFDAEALAFTGEPVAIAPSVATSTALDASFSGTAGLLAYAPRLPAGGQPTWFDRAGRVLGTASDATDAVSLRLSPDGQAVALTRSAPTDSAPEIWLLDIARGAAARFTFNPWLDVSPVWSPDGEAVIFASSRTGRFTLFRRASGGGPEAESFFTADASLYPDDWSRDGRFVVFSTDPPQQSWDLGVLDVTTMRAAALVNTPYNEYQGQISPDARWLAFTSDQSGRPEVYVRRFPAGNTDTLVSTAGGSAPSWRRDGQELFYLDPDGTLMSVPIVNGTRMDLGRPRPLFRTRIPGDPPQYGWMYTVTADGQRFLVVTAVGDAPAHALTVVLDWRAAVRPP